MHYKKLSHQELQKRAKFIEKALMLWLMCEIFLDLTLLDLTHEQLVHGSIEWIGLSKMQLYSKSLFFELDAWNFGSGKVFVSS